jgi:hypothetical protein
MGGRAQAGDPVRGEPVSQKPYKSNSTASDGDLTWFDLRIIRAMQSSGRPRRDRFRAPR